MPPPGSSADSTQVLDRSNSGVLTASYLPSADQFELSCIRLRGEFATHGGGHSDIWRGELTRDRVITAVSAHAL